MSSRDVVKEFLAYEVNDYIRSQLLDAIERMSSGQEYFTYNTFNVLLDVDVQIATVDDELDAMRSETIQLADFANLLRVRG